MANRKHALTGCVCRTVLYVSWSVVGGGRTRINVAERRRTWWVSFNQAKTIRDHSIINWDMGTQTFRAPLPAASYRRGTTISTGGEGRYEDVLVNNIY